MPFLKRIVGLTLGIVCVSQAYAGVPEETCRLVYQKLSSGPYESLTQSIESFTDEGKPYDGCVVRFLGNAPTVAESQRPDGLFGPSLPYCPDGKLPVGLPPDLLNKDGWCGDHMADGPDGTFYRALKKNIFCTVAGRWDGGDDSDSTYVPSARYEVTVKCASR